LTGYNKAARSKIECGRNQSKPFLMTQFTHKSL